MANPFDAATVKWTKAKAELTKVQWIHKKNPYNSRIQNELKEAQNAFDDACLKRQQAREKPSPIDWENMNAHAEP